VLAQIQVPKLGLDASEGEDQARCDAARGLCAVADGASSSAFPGKWAACLTEHFIGRPTINISDDWLAPAKSRFMSALQLDKLPWHAIAKLERGAHATLLGLVVDRETNGFSAVSVGDSLLAWRAGGQPCKLLPPSPNLDGPPFLVSNLSEQNEGLEQKLDRVAYEPINTDTTFYMMTDAIARWFVNEHNSGKQPDLMIDRLITREALGCWIDACRQKGTVENDDLTLVVLRSRPAP